MTGNGLLGELAAWSGLAAPPPASRSALSSAGAMMPGDGGGEQVKIDPILDVCDQVLGETSKRGHVFDWLAPSGIDGDRQAVDAYYAGRNLVVLGQEQSGPHHVLCAELAAHKVEVFAIDLDGFRADQGQAFSRLIGELRQVAAATAPLPRAAPTPASAPPAPPPAPPAPAAPATAAPAPPAPAPAPAFPAPPPPTLAPAPPTTAPAFPPPPPPPPPRPAPVRTSAFQPLVSAVQRYTAAPQPFVMPRESVDQSVPPLAPPAAEPPPFSTKPFAVSLPPVSPALQGYLATPQPPPPLVAAPTPPPAPALSPPPAPPRNAGPVPIVLQQYRPTPPPQPEAPPAPVFNPGAPGSFVATPFPFARSAPAPLPAILESLVAEPERRPTQRRVGQHQAEAAARAARFVESRAVRQGSRPTARPGAPPSPSSRPGPLFGLAAAVAATPAFAPTPEPARDIDGRIVPPSTARAEAIERALARGRTLPDPDRPAPKEAPQAEADELILGFTVACLMAIELYIGVAVFAFGGGPVVLGLGLVLDAAARALGTIAATRAGKQWGPGWRWICGLGGSPAVAWFAFQRNPTKQPADLAPLAGPLAVVAVIIILIGLAGIPAGI